VVPRRVPWVAPAVLVAAAAAVPIRRALPAPCVMPRQAPAAAVLVAVELQQLMEPWKNGDQDRDGTHAPDKIRQRHLEQYSFYWIIVP
jgi:hypothetical protein